MSIPLRSKQGCWTCRLRKKKCDERHPHCGTCESLSITCFGYGPKPDWMKKSDEARAVADSIKETDTSLADTEPRMEGSLSSIPADNSTLLMHFLDNVFPLQYPMYRPDITKGGRGWLLNLLLGSKPFYHAALALSVYHRRTAVPASNKHQVATLVQQEQHLEISLNAMNFAMQNSCGVDARGLGVATAVVQLMLFELFTGDKNACLAHLNAAIGMTRQAFQQNNYERLGLAESTRVILHQDLPVPENEPATAEQVVNFRFLTGTTMWLDIISSITAGTAPQLLPYYSSIIAPASHTKLEGIMGCKNWAMLEIGRIAALHEQCVQAIGRGDFNCNEFQKIGCDITLNIEDGLAGIALEGFSVSDPESTQALNTMPNEHTLITHIFALMASIYLHLAIRGFQELEALDGNIAKGMSMLQAQGTRQLLPALVAPLYIFGVVARTEDKTFLREVLSCPPLLDASLKHRRAILPALEETWRQRERGSGMAWKDCLELARDVFLL
ncbi:hypothetical protein AK830_g5178 [Neonectria ditissima]|uniref:Zn(2)-C6 fungal-type domain-containing protein n=1 Tax=Neonectria ditissima TaxID=78410 RepID=A0A0P7AU26_9HYPO|nr:hypothetical protein AK830_g5178 [Neonectria ditissima]